MPARKIVDDGEVVRWIAEGRTYEWMATEYLTRYGIVIAPTAFSNFRRRRGIDPRITRDDNLIPWHVAADHRWQYPVRMLRALARRRDGRSLPADEARRLDSWLTRMQDERLVVDYDPAAGFVEVPRNRGDDDVIRRPKRPTRQRRGPSSCAA